MSRNLLSSAEDNNELLDFKLMSVSKHIVLRKLCFSKQKHLNAAMCGQYDCIMGVTDLTDMTVVTT